jgi:hypothetical protein
MPLRPASLAKKKVLRVRAEQAPGTLLQPMALQWKF